MLHCHALCHTVGATVNTGAARELFVASLPHEGYNHAVTDELMLRRKWTLRAHDKQVVFVKKINERTEHVLMKAFIWALYLPVYPDLLVEVRVGDRYKPDVVSLSPRGHPRFWGEAGHVSLAKIRSLARRYRDTHFALAKWDTRLEPWVALVRKALEDWEHTAPFDLLCFPSDSVERFLDGQGHIHVAHQDLEWVRLH